MSDTSVPSVTPSDSNGLKFADEEVDSSVGYSSNHKPRPVTEQLTTLGEIFPRLNFDHAQRFVETALPNMQLPSGAEGWFAIVRHEAMASSYAWAIKAVFTLIEGRRVFYNFRRGETGQEYLRQHERTVRKLREVAEQQPGDILILPAQFGLRHRGRSVRRAREVFTSSEFGLGAFASAIMLLTHPEMLSVQESLSFDSSGDEYSPSADGEWDCAPAFFCNDTGLGFSARKSDYVDSSVGPVSGFVPQQ